MTRRVIFVLFPRKTGKKGLNKQKAANPFILLLLFMKTKELTAYDKLYIERLGLPTPFELQKNDINTRIWPHSKRLKIPAKFSRQNEA